MDPVSDFLPVVQPFREIHGEITACFANKEAAIFHELWWSQHGLPLPLYGVRAKLLERLDLDAVPGLDGFPTSLKNFLDTVSPIFDQSLLQGMAERASRLDHVSGVEVKGEMTLSDIFIRRQTHRTWALEIISAIATRYYERTNAAHQGLPDPALCSESVVSDLDLDPLQSIEQITLCGSTMLEAWSQIFLPDAEDYIRQAQDQVRQFECLQLDDNGPESKSLVGRDTSDWLPSHGPSPLPAFHGTHAGFCGFPEDERMDGTCHPSRAIPVLGTMPVVSTGFHAFKTYLCAAFRAEVIFNLFALSMSVLQKRWTVNEVCWTADDARKHFTGVIFLDIN
jgi:hypothetical protein